MACDNREASNTTVNTIAQDAQKSIDIVKGFIDSHCDNDGQIDIDPSDENVVNELFEAVKSAVDIVAAATAFESCVSDGMFKGCDGLLRGLRHARTAALPFSIVAMQYLGMNNIPLPNFMTDTLEQ